VTVILEKGVPSSTLSKNLLQKGIPTDNPNPSNFFNRFPSKFQNGTIASSCSSVKISNFPKRRLETWFIIPTNLVRLPEKEDVESPGEGYMPLPASKFLKETAGLYIQITNLTMTKDITSENPTRKTSEDLSKRR